MSKNKPSKHQQCRPNSDNQRRYSSKKPAPDDAVAANRQEGIVISRFGQHAEVESPEGILYHCNIRRTVPSLVTGDRVVWHAENLQQDNTKCRGVIESVHERTSILTRPGPHGAAKLIAANIDQMVIVAAPLPETSLNVIDRYLVICETMNIKPLIVLNKIDLLESKNFLHINKMIDIYRQIRYRVINVSSLTHAGQPSLEEALAGHMSVFVGQSGVGKSSLLNALLPPGERHILTNTLSERSGSGQHTTTTARLYHFQQGGDVIDSPGIREFGLSHLTPAQITRGFIEFRSYLGNCKFRDCAHANDAGCAIREAVERGAISTARLHNYHQIVASIT